MSKKINYDNPRIRYWARECFNCVHFRSETKPIGQSGYVVDVGYGIWGQMRPELQYVTSCADLGISITANNAHRCKHFIHKETAMNGMTQEQIDARWRKEANDSLTETFAERHPDYKVTIGCAIVGLIVFLGFMRLAGVF